MRDPRSWRPDDRFVAQYVCLVLGILAGTTILVGAKVYTRTACGREQGHAVQRMRLVGDLLVGPAADVRERKQCVRSDEPGAAVHYVIPSADRKAARQRLREAGWVSSGEGNAGLMSPDGSIYVRSDDQGMYLSNEPWQWSRFVDHRATRGD